MDPGVASDVPDPHRLPWLSSLRAFWGASNATGHVEPNLWALAPVARLRNHIWRWGPHTGWSRPRHRSSGCIQRPWSPPRTRSRSWSLLSEVQNSPWRAVLLYSPSVDAKSSGTTETVFLIHDAVWRRVEAARAASEAFHGNRGLPRSPSRAVLPSAGGLRRAQHRRRRSSAAGEVFV